jgi:hypothetical protein
MFSGDSSGTVIVWNTFENVQTKSKKRRSQSAGRTRLTKLHCTANAHLKFLNFHLFTFNS